MGNLYGSDRNCMEVTNCDLIFKFSIYELGSMQIPRVVGKIL